jgi:PAS domain S-box-containing protein
VNDQAASYAQAGEVQERSRAEALLAGEKRLLEMIASGSALMDTLDALCRFVEQTFRDWAVSILLLDDRARRLRHAAAPSLPESFTSRIDGSEAEPTAGPCAMAAHFGEQTIVPDFESDARWPKVRALVLAHGLRACWSTPIKSSQARVLGTFAIYAREPGSPTAQQKYQLEQFTHLASIAIERDCATNALRRSEERYALAMAASGEGHWDWIVASDDFYASPLLLQLCGLPPDSTFASRAEFRERVPFHPDDRPKWEAALKAHFGGADGRLETEMRILRNGETRWIHLTGLCLRDGDGVPARWAGSVSDVTERRRMEAQLSQAQRLEAMGTLAGGIAHDFNNLLGAILGYGEMALSSAPAGSRLRRDIESIMVAGERGRALVDRILAFSRSGVGERIAVNVQKIARETLKLIAAKPPDGVRIEHRLRAGRSAVLGDPTQIHQVLMNLVTNALHAMPTGGTLRVLLERIRVPAARAATMGALAPAEYVALKVADTGTGMTAEILERIFDPFFSTKEVGVGTGLGLSLVHGIVTGLGGAIEVASAIGRGSVFTVYLPRFGEASEGDKARAATASEVSRGHREHILVVDDEAPLVDLVTEALAGLGYTPIGFTSSAAALAAFSADPQRFDAIITDESMPGASGAELIRKIRQIRPEIPALLVSGHVGAAVTQRARQAGADDVLKKPLSTRELATSLARVLKAIDRVHRSDESTDSESMASDAGRTH